MKTLKIIMIMGLIALIFGCGKKTEDRVISGGVALAENTVVITCEMIQEK